MNLDSPTNPREALEASLTAMLLGELPPDQVAFLERLLSGDPQLRATYEQLKQTIGFVCEATKEPKVPEPVPDEALKLSSDRRQRLLAHFKTVPLEQPRLQKKRRLSPVLLVAALLVGTLFLASLFLPALSRAKSKATITSARFSAASALKSEFEQKSLTALQGRLDEVALGVAAPEESRSASIVLPNGGAGRGELQVTTTLNEPMAHDVFNSAPQVGEQLMTVAPATANFNVPVPKAPVINGKDSDVMLAPVPTAGAEGGGFLTGKPPQQEPAQTSATVAGGRIETGKEPLRSMTLADSAQQTPMFYLPPTKSDFIPQAQSASSGGLQAQWSASAGLRGYYDDNTVPPSSALAQPTTLGDQPQAGRLFGVERQLPELAANEVQLKREQVPFNGSGEQSLGFGEKKMAGLDAVTPEAPSAAMGNRYGGYGRTQELPAANDRVERGRRLLERGQTKEAEELLKQAVRDNPQDSKSYGYLNQIQEQQEYKAKGKRAVDSRERLAETEKAWSKPAAPPAAASPAPPTNAPSPFSVNVVGYEHISTAPGVSMMITNGVNRQIADGWAPTSTNYIVDSESLPGPKSGPVQIVDRASAGLGEDSGFTAKLRSTFGGSFEKKARVKTEPEQTDISGSQAGKTSETYDPYFIQTENEVIRSEAVLGRVVDKLQLAGEKSRGDAIRELQAKLDLKPAQGGVLEIGVKSDSASKAANLANQVAESYQEYRNENRQKRFQQKPLTQLSQLAKSTEPQQKLPAVAREAGAGEPVAAPKRSPQAPIPQPEIASTDNAFSTFSLNVSDVSFKLAAASLEKGALPDGAGIRSEEFINAFDYRDPEPPAGMPVGFAYDRARYPFAQNRDLLRFSIKTAAQGRQAGRPLNLVILLDNSGSMERADRVQIIKEALHVLAQQLQPQDKISLITFARTAQLRFDGVAGNQATNVANEASGLTPQGGTNLEEAMNLAYATARRHYFAEGVNRVVLLTDGAANLGDVEPENLKQKVEQHRKQGIALDCFGIGWEGLNDDLLEVLSRNGDGRYGFINTPEEAASGFAGQLAGALRVAAADVKVQVEFNPKRISSWRQIGYAKHQLTKEQFRDNTVDAAELGAAESGNALYVVDVNPNGQGPLATVRVRYKVPGTTDYREHEWSVPFAGSAPALEQAAPAIRLAAVASAFSEWLAASPYAGEVTTGSLLNYLRGVPDVYGQDPRPQKLEWMIRQAKSLSGK